MKDKIKKAQQLIDDVKNQYNSNLHGWQYKSHLDHTASKMKEVLDIFTES